MIDPTQFAAWLQATIVALMLWLAAIVGSAAAPHISPPPTMAPTASPAPTATPTATPTVAPTATPTASPSPTATPTVAPTATPTPAQTPTPGPTQTPAAPIPFPAWLGNTPVGASPAIAGNSAAIIGDLFKQNNQNGPGSVTFPQANDNVPSYWTAKTTDPQAKLSVVNPTGIPHTGSGPFVTNTAFYIPNGACSAGNSDHHISILQPDGTVLDIWEFGNTNSTFCYSGQSNVTVQSAATVPYLSGDGFNQLGGWPAMAAGSSTRMGYDPTLTLNSGVIPHALEASPGCAPDNTIHGQATAQLGQGCPSGAVTSIQAGQYIWSNITPAQLPAVGTSGMDRATRMLCVALNQYGAVVDDTNGNWNAVSFNGLGASTGTDAAAYKAWAAANMTNGTTNPGACLANVSGGWKAHLFVLAR
jgi:hypothetical protein